MYFQLFFWRGICWKGSGLIRHFEGPVGIEHNTNRVRIQMMEYRRLFCFFKIEIGCCRFERTNIKGHSCFEKLDYNAQKVMCRFFNLSLTKISQFSPKCKLSFEVTAIEQLEMSFVVFIHTTITGNTWSKILITGCKSVWRNRQLSMIFCWLNNIYIKLYSHLVSLTFGQSFNQDRSQIDINLFQLFPFSHFI